MEAMEAEIVASEGVKRFGNKFKTSDHEKAYSSKH